MSLSTSSSRTKLAKLVILAVTGFALYSVILQITNPPVAAFQNQWVKNYSVAEKYIYSAYPPKTLIVGSSMATRLVSEKFDKSVYNLSFGGGSALTGLKIIKESKQIPELILIESNIVERALDEDMINNLFIPFLWKMKGHIKSLQYTYQPINVLLSFVKSTYEKNNPATGVDSPNKKILDSALNQHLRNHNSTKGLSDRTELVELKNAVDYFRRLGTRIVFFEMPVHSALLSSPKYARMRSILLTLFPDIRFYWADHSLSDTYITSDGVHLLPHSAGEYSSVLSHVIERESKALP